MSFAARLARLAVLALLVPVLAACGPDVDALLVEGAATLQQPGEPPVDAAGLFPFGRRARLTAHPAGARVRVSCGARVTAEASATGAPAPGVAEFELGAGAQLRRRDDVAFDLNDGTAHIRTGVVPGRLIVMNGTCHISAEGADNPAGIDVVLTAAGEQLSVEVLRGTVLLNETDAEERNTVFVTLAPGDKAVTRPGEEPRKGTTEWTR